MQVHIIIQWFKANVIGMEGFYCSESLPPAATSEPSHRAFPEAHSRWDPEAGRHASHHHHHTERERAPALNTLKIKQHYLLDHLQVSYLRSNKIDNKSLK